MTKGTFDLAGTSFNNNYNNSNYEPRYLISLKHFKSNIFSLCMLENNTNVISIIFFHDDDNFTHFKTLMC